MLAKIWKKVLLAICIIACIYNVMHKLISRTSLELQLKSVQNQGSIFEMLKHDDSTKQKNENSSEKTENENSIQQEENTDNSAKNVSDNAIVVIY